MVGAFIFRALQDVKKRPLSAPPAPIERSISLPTQDVASPDVLESETRSKSDAQTCPPVVGQACMNAALLFNKPKTSARDRQFKTIDKFHADLDRRQDHRRSLDALMERTKALP